MRMSASLFLLLFLASLAWAASGCADGFAGPAEACAEGQCGADGGRPAACTPTTCQQAGATCGTLSDGCGGALSCGDCSAPQSCGGGGTPNVCGCTPTTCARAGKDCGTISDECGGTLACGSSPGLTQCGAGGVSNVCGRPAGAYTRKVMVLVVDPVLTSQGGKTLVQYKNWNDPAALARDAVRWFTQLSQGRVGYELVDWQLASYIPRKEDGFTYTEAQYLDVVDRGAPPHQPDIVDYHALLNAFSVCDKVNSGAIDEVWMFGGPWLGFYESRLAGPDAYWFNSPPLTGTSCTRRVPIMGLNYERGLTEIIHDWGHRIEATMTQVYGSWEQNRTAHNWDRFALVKAQSPSFAFSGCGTTHHPPNATRDYDYANPATVDTYCDDFLRYPNLSAPSSVLQKVTCATWGCTQLGYLDWMFRRLPRTPGVGPDGKSTDWWSYILTP